MMSTKMEQNIFEAYIRGPKTASTAKLMLLIAAVVAAFVVVLTGAIYVYVLVSGLDGVLGDLLSDPTIPATLAVMAIAAWFTYKAHRWAAVLLLINQLLDLLFVATSDESSVGIISLLKLLVFVGAVRASFYLKNSSTDVASDPSSGHSIRQ